MYFVNLNKEKKKKTTALASLRDELCLPTEERSER